MAALLVGPLLRWVSQMEATVWVETDAPCDVEILGHAQRTFHVEGHHYALVIVRGLEPDRRYEYDVRLDGQPRWPVPESGFPPSVIRTLDTGPTARIVFGSCRVSVPHVSPFSLDRLIDSHGRGLDALAAFARRLIDEPRQAWPHVLLLLGDQVYADDVPQATLEFIRSRRDADQPPGESVADFEEYANLYCASWTEPLMRWLLSTVSSSMIFDDHDVIDDWNISEAWLADMRATDWWEGRIVSAFMSYWIYQHLGNLSPADLDGDALYAAVRAADDAGPLLRRFSFFADRESAGSRWAYRRDVGGTRLIVLDSRAARVLRDGRREMLDEAEWRWLEANLEGPMDHLVIASSLPMLMAQGMHHAETWSERVGDGAWGRLPARAMEKLRRALDMEHWAAFGTSLERLMKLLAEVGSGRRGPAPSSIVMVSGDVHHGYLARVAYRRKTGVKSAVYQSVTSPFRNPLGRSERMFQRVAASRGMAAVTRLLAASSGVPESIVRWRRLEGHAFDNQVSTLETRGRSAVLRLEKAVAHDGPEGAALEPLWQRRLAPAPGDAKAMATDTNGAPADHVDRDR